MSFSRTINIRSSNLGIDTVLILTFDKSIPGMFRDAYPIAWRVSAFGATGNHNLQATYVANLGFTKAQVEGDKVAPASTYIAVNPEQQTTLTKTGAGGVPIYNFSNPVGGPPLGIIRATNQAEEIVQMGVGFFAGQTTRPPSTVLVFKEVGHTLSVQAEFTPRLSAYVTSNYQETEVIRGEISSPVIWEENLAQLGQTTHWEIKRLPSGQYVIVADSLRIPTE